MSRQIMFINENSRLVEIKPLLLNDINNNIGSNNNSNNNGSSSILDDQNIIGNMANNNITPSRNNFESNAVGIINMVDVENTDTARREINNISKINDILVNGNNVLILYEKKNTKFNKYKCFASILVVAIILYISYKLGIYLASIWYSKNV